ncbi:3-phosphoglycerate dehydrogenase [Infirmifilum lucidum]|uniref:3-phosphoglycerate dehydrogenase n=1 Tax=Infirmifilum lucidum TaxID=2776706 RepID=A0A7L9FJI3_9CREN|nr:NAD(P)-dependent oxidoreductase [Infirmifilum lucidum]QOJ79811.1 3-phosphoglycerate dehydrogenase [Infirmifilum lucidum]
MEFLKKRETWCLAFVSRVLVADSVPESFLQRLSSLGFSVDYRPGVSREALVEMLDGYEVLVFRSRLRVNRELIDSATSLRVLARYGVGLDNVDVDYAVSRGIAVVNAPCSSAVSVAELTLGLLLMLFRNLYQHVDSVKKGYWSKGAFVGRELHGKTLGVVGFGRIGRLVARYAASLNMRVLVADVRDVSREASEVGAEQVGLEELLSSSHAVTLHVPLTPKTHRMISWREFSIMREGAFLVNTSRGEVVDSEALLANLDRLGGVALDVLEEEPPRSERLLRIIAHPKVIVTPHIGAETLEAQERIGEELAVAIREAVERL